jgi:hypothetical protein
MPAERVLEIRTSFKPPVRETRSANAMQSRVLVARRYVERGFLDSAMRLYAQNPGVVDASDWIDLADKMIERDRIDDAVRVCEAGGVPLPRERLLAIGDRCLERRDTNQAIHFYEKAAADEARWSRVVDVLTNSPDQELLAIELAERYLISKAPVADARPVSRIKEAS